VNPKTKKVLVEQSTQVVQALKWIGGALFGDADDVLDDIAARGDAEDRAHGRPARGAATPTRRRGAPTSTGGAARKVEPEVIDVEAFVDEDDE
jgi:hypothetical protein